MAICTTEIDYPKFERLVKRTKSFILTTHVNPDGDGLGSELALAYALRARGAQVTILNHSTTPENYLWMDPDGDIVHFQPVQHTPIIEQADLIVILDTSQPQRLRSLEPHVRKSKAKMLIIDHHLDPHPFANHYVLDEDATSTGEILYRIMHELELPLTQRIASVLYTAIMTDTGSFRYPRTDADTYRIAADLLEHGADPTTCYSNVYEQWTTGRMRLLGETLDSMRTAADGRIAWVVCTQEMFKNTGTTVVDTDNFTVYPMSIQGVLIGILFNELSDGIKISFRSKGTIPVNRLAAEYGGGGHLNAAGARLFHQSLNEIVPKVIELAGKYLPLEKGSPTSS